ncbi:MAG: serine hydrolase [Bacteroidetes bacterium]|nr:serine hydrolase [Bacteroidota bacterium]
MSNRERLSLLFYSNNPNDSSFFEKKKEVFSPITKAIPFIKSDKKTVLYSQYLNQNNEGNLLFNRVLGAAIPSDIDFYTDNPLARAEWCDSLVLENLKWNTSLVFNHVSDVSKSKGLNEKDIDVKIYSAIRLMRQSDKAFLEVSDLNSPQEVLHLYQKTEWKGIVSRIKDIDNQIFNEDSLYQYFKSGVGYIDVKEDVKEAFLNKYSTNDHFKEIQGKEKCLKLLTLKKAMNKPLKPAVVLDEFQLGYRTNIAALTCIANESGIIPIKNNLEKCKLITGSNQSEMRKSIINYVDISEKNAEHEIYNGFELDFFELLKKANNSESKKKILIISAEDLYKYRTLDYSVFEAILLTPDNSLLSQKNAVQAIYGALPCTGRLPFFLNLQIKNNFSIETRELNRLRYAEPIYLGIPPDSLFEIGSIVQNALNAEAFPGCQVLFAWKNTVVYQESYGFVDHTKKQKVDNQIIYDLASISKIAGSTVGLMFLEGQNKFSLDKNLGDYLKELNMPSAFQQIRIKNMMAHQAGLPAWIPFYKRTLNNGVISKEYYSKEKSGAFSVPVARGLYVLESMSDSIDARILAQKLGGNDYLYSDLGYYFVKKIIEKQSNEKMDVFLREKVFGPLGLRSMRYNPYLNFGLDQIAPTENDKEFRNQTIHGYVHDPGAALLGGVGGHAGLFANANDLAILMQMILNGGTYGGKEILKKEVIQKYTSVQFPEKNRRGAGFDKPTFTKKGGTACPEVSSKSYGHSGFTGTLTWADPEEEVNYVFLSNRVNPNAENWKIVKMNIRTEIQSVFYRAIKSAKFTDYSNRL